MPRQHLHAYAADFQRGLPTDMTTRLRSWPPDHTAVTHCIPAHIRQVGAGTGFTELWHWFLSYTFSSR